MPRKRLKDDDSQSPVGPGLQEEDAQEAEARCRTSERKEELISSTDFAWRSTPDKNREVSVTVLRRTILPQGKGKIPGAKLEPQEDPNKKKEDLRSS